MSISRRGRISHEAFPSVSFSDSQPGNNPDNRGARRRLPGLVKIAVAFILGVSMLLLYSTLGLKQSKPGADLQASKNASLETETTSPTLKEAVQAESAALTESEYPACSAQLDLEACCLAKLCAWTVNGEGCVTIEHATREGLAIASCAAVQPRVPAEDITPEILPPLPSIKKSDSPDPGGANRPEVARRAPLEGSKLAHDHADKIARKKVHVAHTAVHVVPIVEQLEHSIDAHHATYQLKVRLVNGASTLYSIVATQAGPMELPPAFQVEPPLGSHVGGSSPEMTELSVNAAYDSYLTIGITGGDHNSELGIVGVDEQLLQWSDTHGIQILDGGIFWMNPTQSTVNLQVIEEEGPAMVGQLTVPLGYRGVAAMGMAGDGVDGHSWRDDRVVFPLADQTQKAKAAAAAEGAAEERARAIAAAQAEARERHARQMDPGEEGEEHEEDFSG